MKARSSPDKDGRVFILRDEGAPEQLNKTMPLRDMGDLENLGGLIKKTADSRKPSGAANGSVWDSLQDAQRRFEEPRETRHIPFYVSLNSVDLHTDLVSSHQHTS